MTLLWAILICAAVVFVVALPLFERGHVVAPHSVPAQGYLRRDLREEKARFLLALRDLDFDYETGKLSPADYKELRAQTEMRAIEVLKKLEEVEKEWVKVQATVDEELSKKMGVRPIAMKGAAQESRSTTSCPSCGAGIAAGDRFCGSCGAQARLACTACGGELQGTVRFCPHCGVEQKARLHAKA